MKKEVEAERACALVGPRLAVLTTCVDEKGTPNVLTQTWITPVSFSPNVLALATYQENYSYELIEKSGEFVVNIPTVELLEMVWFCGSNSGRDVDKFAKTGLTPEKSEVVAPPSIRECVASIECRVVKSCDVGNHRVFFGEIVKARAESQFFDKTYLLSEVPLPYVDGEKCYTLNPESI